MNTINNLYYMEKLEPQGSFFLRKKYSFLLAIRYNEIKAKKGEL